MAGYIPGHIQHVETADLGDVLKSLIAAGLTFNVTRNNDRSWNVELTGGY